MKRIAIILSMIFALPAAAQEHTPYGDIANSVENRLLGGAAMGVTGAGGMLAGQGIAESVADNASSREMREYRASFKCGYPGNYITGDGAAVSLPYDAELFAMREEYIALAKQTGAELPTDKSALYEFNTATLDSQFKSADERLAAGTANAKMIGGGVLALGGIAGSAILNNNLEKKNADKIDAAAANLKEIEDGNDAMKKQLDGRAAPAAPAPATYASNPIPAGVETAAPANAPVEWEPVTPNAAAPTVDATTDIIAPKKTDTKMTANTDFSEFEMSDAEHAAIVADMRKVSQSFVDKDLTAAFGNQYDAANHKLTLTTNFDTDSYAVRGADRTNIDKLSGVIKNILSYDNSGNVAVKIDGYTDKNGTAAINNPLSKNRAGAVADIIRGAVGSNRVAVSSAGYGSASLKSTDRDSRRVEITVTANAG